jgi:hypothetical protein
MKSDFTRDVRSGLIPADRLETMQRMDASKALGRTGSG